MNDQRSKYIQRHKKKRGLRKEKTYKPEIPRGNKKPGDVIKKEKGGGAMAKGIKAIPSLTPIFYIYASNHL